MGSPVSWFEIPAADPRRLAAFYKAAFGWGVEQYPGAEYFLLDTEADGSGIGGAITKRGALQSPATTLYVESLEGAIATVRANGGTILGEPITVPEVGTYAYAADPEGNIFGMLQQAAR
jgi:predicted enzyme related to lactoylglutathione lyase